MILIESLNIYKRNEQSMEEEHKHKSIKMEGLDINILPEGCISSVLSFTSPLDACRSSLVSSIFQSAADSDVVWERFLPSDYQEILSRSVSPVQFSSKKDLFFHLCDPFLIDGGNKSFALEKSSGRKCNILSARELSITWGNDPMDWSWKSLPESRFSEVAELRTICQLEIHGKIYTGMLTPNTTYAAYLIMKISDRAYGLDSLPAEISLEVGGLVTTGTAYLRRQDSQKQKMEHLFYSNRMQMLLRSRVIEGDGRVPCDREDGWMEIELGEFVNEGGEGVVKMSLMEVKGDHLKGGLIIEGIEVRPKYHV
ncbi:hypothetical protein HHK36_020818 [Tetracentron sinense]|uniref:F-box domain-containing protein n=1 Tax=Tetracentron sinense TaxID=13715 RepID=A0A834YSD6_TETSI|nr:hypothetical protein HHK36_020818 [Tetracentron sinense]